MLRSWEKDTFGGGFLPSVKMCRNEECRGSSYELPVHKRLLMKLIMPSTKLQGTSIHSNSYYLSSKTLQPVLQCQNRKFVKLDAMYAHH